MVHKLKRFIWNTPGTLTVEILALCPHQHDKSPLNLEVANSKTAHVISTSQELPIISPNHLQWPPNCVHTHTCMTAVSDFYFCCLNQHNLILHEGQMFSLTVTKSSYIILYCQY